MYKKLSFLFLTGLISLTACGSDESNVNEEQEVIEVETTNEVENVNSQDEEESDDEILGINEDSAEVTFIQEQSISWVAESSNIGHVSFSGIIQNNTNDQIDATEMATTYYAEDGTVIAKSDLGFYITPSVIPPNETAQVRVYELITEDQVNSFDHAETNVSTFPIGGEVFDLPVDNVSISKEGQFKVSGTVENNLKADLEKIEISVALFDTEGDLLGIMNTFVEENLSPGNKTGFEMFDPFPDEYVDKVDSYEINAYYIFF